MRPKPVPQVNMETLSLYLHDHTVQLVFLGSIILGITAGCLGAFAVLRQQSLLGDAISHATLPGICLAFMLTQTKHPIVLLLGAGAAGWLGSLWIKIIVENTRIKKDAALGIVLSVFFGLGLVFLTIIQRFPSATKAGLDKFLFGNAATLLISDINVMLVLSAIALACVMLFWKEFKLIVFDEEFARSQGMKVHFFDIFLSTLIVVAIVIGLQTVGVVLMSAMLVAPAAAARQWTDRLSVMIVLSAFFGCLAGTSGAVTSSVISHMPTGPTIVVYLSVLVLISLLFAPNRGLLWDWIRYQRNKRKIQFTAVLKNLLLFSEINTDPFHAHDIAALDAIGRGAAEKTMYALKREGFVQQSGDFKWALTKEGLREAKRLTDEYEAQFNE